MRDGSESPDVAGSVEPGAASGGERRVGRPDLLERGGEQVSSTVFGSDRIGEGDDPAGYRTGVRSSAAPS